MPAVSAFHEGPWDVEVQGAGQDGVCASVRIPMNTNLCRSWGPGLGFRSRGRQRLVRQEVFREMDVHDDWTLESEFGLSYESLD